jgi:hypothetical protein
MRKLPQVTGLHQRRGAEEETLHRHQGRPRRIPLVLMAGFVLDACYDSCIYYTILALAVAQFVLGDASCEIETNSMDGAAAFPVAFQRKTNNTAEHPNRLGSAFPLARATGGRGLSL